MHTQKVDWAATRRERKTITAIADRAVKLLPGTDHLHVQMDIEATHCNGCALRLDDLLNADDFNFAHDVSGIARHLNRDTGRLTNHFLPRFAKCQ